MKIRRRESVSGVYTFNGDGVRTCRCCEKRMTSSVYDNVCSSSCSALLLEYNSIPVNKLFIQRVFVHTRDENVRKRDINKFIESNKLNKVMATHKIEKVADLFLKNQINFSGNTIYKIG